jgi:hypothetical protein
MRRKRGLNFAYIDGPPPTVDARSIDWNKIEAGYGQSIGPVARVEIVEATNKFLEFSAFALAAPSLSDALKRAEVVKECAADMLNILSDRTELSRMIDGMIERQLKSFSARTKYDLVLIADAASCLIAASEKTRTELKERSLSELRADAHWDLWVRRVTGIAKKHGLPHGIRKDRMGNPGWKASPFVHLIKALQRHLPAAQRRRAATDEGLSQAIVAARATASGK